MTTTLEAMGAFQKRAAAMALALSFLLLAGAVAGDHPQSSSAAKHEETPAPPPAHARKLLLDATSSSRMEGASRAAAASSAPAVEEISKRRARGATPGECSQAAVVVSQGVLARLPDGVPSYSVTITNTCVACTVRDVHVACGDFGSMSLVDPGSFRRVGDGDCLVRGGGALGPGDSVTFQYSNTLPFKLHVASVSCG